jgi:hypothetical protein
MPTMMQFESACKCVLCRDDLDCYSDGEPVTLRPEQMSPPVADDVYVTPASFAKFITRVF